MHALMLLHAIIMAQWVIKGHELYVFLSFQLLLPLKTQEDLDQAVLTLGCSSGTNGLLRILLKTPKNNHVSSQHRALLEGMKLIIDIQHVMLPNNLLTVSGNLAVLGHSHF